MSLISYRNVSVAVSASVVASLLYFTFRDETPSRIHVIPSPRTDVDKLSKSEQDALPYSPDAFPGRRDVGSQYGSIRVYEFGDENGRKVLIIHGISTPCVAMTTLANSLVKKGCRVMLLDLFGRGYSDSPSTPHTAALYNTQINLALTSSPLPWTESGFSLIGYSFGGGVATSFASSHPDIVQSIVLLAPGGLIRARHFDTWSKIMFSGWVPKAIVEKAVRGRMGGNGNGSERRETGDDTTGEEIRGNRDPVFENTVIEPEKGTGVTIGDVVGWQVQNHKGFIQTFVSSMQYGPTGNLHKAWRILKREGVKVMVVVASGDSVIDAKELREDIVGIVGEGFVVWKVIEGGHEFAIGNGGEVGDLVGDFWGLH